ncbi:MAG: ABC transporter ATP-binding protein [Desulfobacteraceae bacterium]|nr:ABC transporter ATP-binding protein [Desulfobacteraceae bacterium]
MIDVIDLKKYFPVVSGIRSLFSRSRGKVVKAVDSVSFQIETGQVLGLVGESGCGKSTTGRVLLDLEQPTSGDILINGESGRALKKKNRKTYYRRIQMIFQDPYGSINPQHNVASILSRPLMYQGIRDKTIIRDKMLETLDRVGLSPPEAFLEKYPHLLSGGQRQRLCIGRAIILEPEFLVADEPISMLDVSIKSGIIILLKRLVREQNLSLLYITHDLATVGHLCDKIAIMYMGRIVEIGPTDDVLDRPGHPYTRALISSIPIPDPSITRSGAPISGAISDPVNLPSGCRFHPRCPYAENLCRQREPVSAAVKDNPEHGAACFLTDKLPGFDLTKGHRC